MGLEELIVTGEDALKVADALTVASFRGLRKMCELAVKKSRLFSSLKFDLYVDFGERQIFKVKVDFGF